MLTRFLALCGLCVLPLPVQAQYVAQRIVQQSCLIPQQTYAAPYASTYQYPIQKVVAQQVAVAPFVVTVPIESKAVPVQAYGDPYYYSVSEAFNAKSTMRDVIREELRNFTQAQVQQQQSAPAQPQAQPPLNPIGPDGHPRPGTTPETATNAPPPVPPAPLTAPPEVSGENHVVLDDTTAPDLQEKVLAAFRGKGNCLNCHGPAGKQPFKLVDENERLLKIPQSKRWDVYGRTSAGNMPPSARKDASKAVEVEHLPALLQWASIK